MKKFLFNLFIACFFLSSAYSIEKGVEEARISSAVPPFLQNLGVCLEKPSSFMDNAQISYIKEKSEKEPFILEIQSEEAQDFFLLLDEKNKIFYPLLAQADEPHFLGSTYQEALSASIFYPPFSHETVGISIKKRVPLQRFHENVLSVGESIWTEKVLTANRAEFKKCIDAYAENFFKKILSDQEVMIYYSAPKEEVEEFGKNPNVNAPEPHSWIILGGVPYRESLSLFVPRPYSSAYCSPM